MTDSWEQTGLRFLEENHRILWPKDVKELNALLGISEYVMNHLNTQRAQSATFDHDGEVIDCLYRGPGNNMCAVGCLIDDSVMTWVQEGVSASDLVTYPRDNQVVQSILNKVSSELTSNTISREFSESLADILQFWQFYHDGADCYNSWLSAGGVEREDELRRGMSPNQVHKEVEASIMQRFEELGDESVNKRIKEFLSH